MPTPAQLGLIHVAAKQVGLDDGDYRLLLRNVADVESAKELDNAGVEDVMAVLEDLGFRKPHGDPDYWRNKVRWRGSRISERMAWKIEAMGKAGRYELPALCLRFSHDYTADVRKLEPWQAYALIEMLKAAESRDADIDASEARKVQHAEDHG